MQESGNEADKHAGPVVLAIHRRENVLNPDAEGKALLAGGDKAAGPGNDLEDSSRIPPDRKIQNVEQKLRDNFTRVDHRRIEIHMLIVYLYFSGSSINV